MTIVSKNAADAIGALSVGRQVIFTVSAIWDKDAKVWSGRCDDIPAAADAATLDDLLTKISRMALDLAADNHPGLAPEDIFVQIVALREATPLAS